MAPRKRITFTEVSFGGIDNTLERKVVPIGRHAEVRECVLDLFPVKKLRAAVYDIGKLAPAKDLLEVRRT